MGDGYLIMEDQIHKISINLTASLSFSQNTLFFTSKIPELASQSLRFQLSGSSGKKCVLNLTTDGVATYSMTYFYLFLLVFEIALGSANGVDTGRTRDNYYRHEISENLNIAQMVVIAILGFLAFYRAFWIFLLYQIKCQSWFQQFLRLILFLISIYRVCVDSDKTIRMCFLEGSNSLRGS